MWNKMTNKDKIEQDIEDFIEWDKKARRELLLKFIKLRRGKFFTPSEEDIRKESIIMDISIGMEEEAIFLGRKRLSKPDGIDLINHYVEYGDIKQEDVDSTLWTLQRIYQVVEIL